MRIGDRAEELRQAFDRSFAEAPREEVAHLEHLLLAIRIAGVPYALPLKELSGLSTGRRVTPLPTAVAGLLGIAGFRGTLVPVYDMRVLFGYPGTGAPRWLGLVGKELVIGLAFDDFDGYLRVPPEAITRQDAEGAPTLVHEVVQAGDLVRPLVHLPSVIDAIKQRARAGVAQKER